MERNFKEVSAYSSGADCAVCGGQEHQCPYNWSNPLYSHWLAGFNDTKEEMRMECFQNVNE